MRFIACVANVSVRLSARSKHFSLFWPRENCFHQCCTRPNFCAAKKRKTPRTGGKPYGNACYVGYALEFAAFRISFDAKYSRASAFCFFLSTTMVFMAFRTHFAWKNTSIFMLIGSLSRKRNKY